MRVVGEKGEQLGIMTTAAALELARKASLDLIEVAPTAVPPVCRLGDYGKFKYEQSKKERESKKGQRVSLLREIRIRPKIGEHDFQAKARSAAKLLDEGNKVKVTVMFRGREVTHPELGWKLLHRMGETLKEAGAIDRQAGMETPRSLSVILAPLTAQKAKPKEKEPVKEPVKEEAREINAKT